MLSITEAVPEKFRNVDRTQFIILTLDNLIWPILALVIIGFSFLLPEIFLTANNLQFLIYSSAALGLIVLAEAVCLLSGHFDLSVGSVAGFSAMFTAMFMSEWIPSTPGWAGVLLILVVGGAIGLLNGLSISLIGVNPFLQTLAFFIIFRGGVILLSTYSIADLPESYLYLGGGSFSGVPIAIFLVLGIYLVIGFWLKYFRSGQAIYAVGGDKMSAREAGIDTTRIVVMVYVFSGTLAALGGLLYTGFLGAATPSLARNTVFPAFAAAVIGGVSLFGGRGNVIGALGGVLLLGTIQTGLVMLNVRPELVQMVNGFVLLFAILLYTVVERLRTRALSE
ncbi:ABC transporter permease [Halomicrococcus sp. NG-SE-24]|uniref:ABC transporter permease n=1 Tax=Halomicrococcus sp. NG-SE-24 TaxID=3436928 RepID=UPI003D99DADF